MTDPQLPPPPPVYSAPPGAYAAPVGGYAGAAPVGGYQAPSAPEPRSAALGVIALVLGIVAAVVAPILGGISGYGIGREVPRIAEYIGRYDDTLSFLAPVRDQVLLGEVGLWVGTLSGIAAIVLGIVAIARRQGRGWGIGAIVLGAAGAIIFFVVCSIALGAGAAAGAVAIYGS